MQHRVVQLGTRKCGRIQHDDTQVSKELEGDCPRRTLTQGVKKYTVEKKMLPLFTLVSIDIN